MSVEKQLVTVEKVVRDDKVAVLYSPGFGAGWSSWVSDEFRDFALFDSNLVALVERGASAEEVEAYLKDRLGDAHFYTGGWRDIEIAWLERGTAFKIHEYDGAESIEEMGKIAWAVA